MFKGEGEFLTPMKWAACWWPFCITNLVGEHVIVFLCLLCCMCVVWMWWYICVWVKCTVLVDQIIYEPVMDFPSAVQGCVFWILEYVCFLRKDDRLPLKQFVICLAFFHSDSQSPEPSQLRMLFADVLLLKIYISRCQSSLIPLHNTSQQMIYKFISYGHTHVYD